MALMIENLNESRPHSVVHSDECRVTTTDCDIDLFAMITEGCDDFKSIDATENTQGTYTSIDQPETKPETKPEQELKTEIKTKKIKPITLTNLKIIGLIKDLHDALLYSIKGISVNIERISMSKLLGVNLSLNRYHKLIQAEINKLTPRRQINLTKRFEKDFCVDFNIYCENICNMNKQYRNMLKSKKEKICTDNINIKPESIMIAKENKANLDDIKEIAKIDLDIDLKIKQGVFVLKNQETKDWLFNKLDYHIDKPLPMLNKENVLEQKLEIEENKAEEHKCWFEQTSVYNIIKCKTCGKEEKTGLFGGVGNKKKAEFQRKTDKEKFDEYIRGAKEGVSKHLPALMDRVMYNQIVNAGLRVLAGVVGVDYKDNEPDNEILARINQSPNAQNMATRALVRDLNIFMSMPTVQVSGLIRLRDDGERRQTFTYKVSKVYADKLNEDSTFKSRFASDTLRELIKEYYDDELVEIIGDVEINFLTNLPNIRDMKMFGYDKNLLSIFDNLNAKGFSHQKGSCVIDYIFNVYMDAMKESEKNKTTRFKNITRKKIVDEFKEIGVFEEDGINTRDILMWAERKQYVTVYAVNANLELYEKMIAKQKPRIILSYVSAHGHLYPISDKVLQDRLSDGGKIKFSDLNTTSFTVISDNIKLIQFDSNEAKDFIHAKHFDVDCLMIEEDNEHKITDLLRQVALCDKTVQLEINQEEDYYDERIEDINTIEEIALDSDMSIAGFVHPVSGVAIKKTTDFENRKKICTYLRKKYDTEDFSFCDQQWSQIGAVLQHLIIGKLPDSYDMYNDQYMEQYQPFGVKQILKLSTRDQAPKNALALDHKRFYTTCLYNNEDCFPVYCELDDIKKFTKDSKLVDKAEYLIGDFKSEELEFVRQWWTARDTRYLLENKIIQRSDIEYYRPFRKEIAFDTFKVLIDEVQALEKELDIPKLDKKIMNSWIGLQNKRYNKRVKGYGTSDAHEAFGLYASVQSQHNEVMFRKMDYFDHSLYILKFITTERVKENYTSIWRNVMSHANVYLIKKLKQLRRANIEMCLWSVKIDAIYLSGVENRPDDDKWVEEKWDPPLFDYKGVDRDVFETDVKWNEITKEDLTQDIRSCMIEGPAGAGKTTFLINLIKENRKKNYIISAFMHAALCTIKEKINDKIKEDNLNLELVLEEEDDEKEEEKKREENQYPVEQFRLKTIDSVLQTYTQKRYGKPPKKIDFNVLIVDELSMLNKEHITKLYRFTKANGITVIGFGDMNQCPPVEIDGVIYDYTNIEMFKKMFQTHIYMNFKAEYGRYDQETFDLLEYILTNRKLPPVLKDLKINYDLQTNITRTRRKRDEINKRQGANKYVIGQRIIADYNSRLDKTLKKGGFFHSNFYYIKEIKDDYIKVDGCEIEIPYGVFFPTNAVTTYKYQGKTIEEDYNIHEIEMMTIKEFYTAASRCRSWKQWRLDYNEKLVFPEQNYTKTIIEKPATLNPHNIIKIGDDYHYFDNATISDYCERHGLDNINQCEVVKENVKCSTKYGLTKLINKHKKVRYNIRNVAPNTLSKELLERKIPIKDNGKGLLSIRKQLYGKKIKHTRVYTDENKEEMMEEMKEIQGEIIDEYYSNLIDEGIESDEHKITFKKGVFETSEIIDIDVEEFFIRKSFIAEIEKFKNSEGFEEQLKWYKFKEPARVEARKTHKRIIARQVRKLITEKIVSKKEDDKKEEDGNNEVIYIKKEKIVYEYAAISKDDLLVYLTQFTNVYEVLESVNTSLFTDFDLDTYEAIDCTNDPEHLLDLFLDLMKETSQFFGIKLEDKFFRILSACTQRKISFHINYLKEVFETNQDQVAFWEKALEIAINGNYDDLWYVKEQKDGSLILKSVIDMSVYYKNKQMRAIYSEKLGKGNYLKPVKFEKGEIVELDRKKINIEDYLIERRKVFTSKLSGGGSNKNKRGGKTHSNSKHQNGDAIIQKINYDDPIVKQLINTLTNATDFNLNKIQIKKYTGGELVCLERQKEGYCGCCGRNHNNAPAKVWMHDNKIKWYGCMNTDKRISYN